MSCCNNDAVRTLADNHPKFNVETDSDYEAERNDQTVTNTSDESVTVTLPDDALTGDSITILSRSSATTVAVDEDDTLSGSSSVAQGTAATYFFAANDDDCSCDSGGTWLQECCPAPHPS